MRKGPCWKVLNERMCWMKKKKHNPARRREYKVFSALFRGCKKTTCKKGLRGLSLDDAVYVYFRVITRKIPRNVRSISDKQRISLSNFCFSELYFFFFMESSTTRQTLFCSCDIAFRFTCLGRSGPFAWSTPQGFLFQQPDLMQYL